VFIENGARRAKLITENIQKACGFEGETTLMRSDATAAVGDMDRGAVDRSFLIRPYGKGTGARPRCAIKARARRSG